MSNYDIIKLIIIYYKWRPKTISAYREKGILKMGINTFGGFNTIDEYVDYKLSKLEESNKSMQSLYELMFSEGENTFCEMTDGYKIKKVSYKESKSNIEIKAKKLSAILKGVEKNSIIGLYLENSLSWLELFWAIMKSGYRPLLVNTRIDDETLNKVYKEYEVKAVISENKNFNVKNIYLNEIEEGKDEEESDFFSDEVLLMSSNTSNRLKISAYRGIEFYYQIKDSGNIIKESESIKRHYNGELKHLTVLPFYHIFGLVAVYIWFCFFSRTLVLLKDFNPKTVQNTVRKHNITHIFAVPLFYEKIYKTAIQKIKEKGEKTYAKFQQGLKIYDSLNFSKTAQDLFSKIAFKEIRENLFGDTISFLINGGGYISSETIKFFNAIGYHLANGYGMTEVGISSVELSEKGSVRNLSSVGKPFCSLEYKINDEGELLIKGKSVAHKIYVDSKESEQKDEWFNTHDLFSCKDGRYYIDGRKDDLIICQNGENLNPNLYEAQFKTNGINNTCIISSNKSVVLLIEVNKYVKKERFEEIKNETVQKLSSLNVASLIQKIVYTKTELLLSDDFKLNRRKLKKRYEDNEIIELSFDEKQNESEFDELEMRIAEIFALSIGKKVEEISLDGHFFFDLGGSSLDYFTMITNLQNEFQISFPSSTKESYSTVREMSNYIRKNT